MNLYSFYIEGIIHLNTNNVKNFIIAIAAAVTFSVPAYSQLKVYPVEKKELNSKDLSEEAIQRLRDSQTMFFYRSTDDLIELRNALEDVWTISDLFLFPYSEMGKVNLKGKSYFVIEGFRRVTSQYTTVDNTFLYLHLYMNFEDKKGREFRQSFARLELFPSFETISEVWKKEEEEVIDYLYTDAEIRNWNPGFLRNYLRNINNLLDEGGERGLYKGEDKIPEISQLANKTLYIPDYTLLKMNKFNGSETDLQEQVKLMKKYPYPYEFKAAAEISDMILEGEDFYYLVYTKSSTEKYFTIYHSTNGEIVFNKYKPMSYNLKTSDFKDIAKSIKKMERRTGRKNR